MIEVKEIPAKPVGNINPIKNYAIFKNGELIEEGYTVRETAEAVADALRKIED